jgi:hypothetical protein
MFNGGTVGIEGSVGALVVWVVLLVIAIVYFRSGSKAQA